MLTDRITLTGPQGHEAEDYLSSSLGVIFPDDITDHHGDTDHGDTDHGVIYAAPGRAPLHLSLANPQGEASQRLFSHYLWNAGVQLAVLIEEGGDRDHGDGDDDLDVDKVCRVRGQRVLELGAGTGLAGFVAALEGADEVVVTDYPAPEVLANIRINVARNVKAPKAATTTTTTTTKSPGRVRVQGHEWGRLGVASEDNRADEGASAQRDDDVATFARENRGSFGRVLVADCLWMPWQQVNLMRSIEHFLTPHGRAWVVAGFHTGRAKMAGFYHDQTLAEQGLEIERIWERDAEGKERDWLVDRGGGGCHGAQEMAAHSRDEKNAKRQIPMIFDSRGSSRAHLLHPSHTFSHAPFRRPCPLQRPPPPWYHGLGYLTRLPLLEAEA
ncbi:MAG: hypothetical protein M1818_004639 [Claussenomyces sp. TS43310]|nr:MAG: hypothetical protein M1818_004639 [Claussenomyces sp. TS43310]